MLSTISVQYNLPSSARRSFIYLLKQIENAIDVIQMFGMCSVVSVYVFGMIY